MLAVTLSLGEICTAQAAAGEYQPESIEASADPAESAGTAENQAGIQEEENRFHAENHQEPEEGQSRKGGAAEAAAADQQEPGESQSREGGAAEAAEGTPEPAENFVPENMTLVSGADAQLLPVQELAYDAASGMLTWQPSELADEYQIEVTDAVTNQSAASLTAKLGQIVSIIVA